MTEGRTAPAKPATPAADLPPKVREILGLATEFGLQATEPVEAKDTSSVLETGMLLRTLSTLVSLRRNCGHPRVLELGTGVGLGSAWILDGLAEDGELLTVEINGERAETARRLLADDKRVTVRCEDWHELSFAGFDLAFPDSCHPDDLRPPAWDRIVDLVVPGGLLVLDDLTPPGTPDIRGNESVKREFAFNHPRLTTVQVATTPLSYVLVCVRNS